MIDFIRGKTSSGKDPPKWWYYYNLSELRGFLSSKFGRPKVFTKDSFRAQCKKGIVILDMQFATGTGHADLWDGGHMIDRNDMYIERASRIEFWELKDKK